jgi:hypothetical protein
VAARDPEAERGAARARIPLHEREDGGGGGAVVALADKERICETLDQHVRQGSGDEEAESAATGRWAALPALPPAWEKAMLARRDAAIAGFYAQDAADAHFARIEEGAEARGEILLDVEMQLGLAIPPELQAQRLALQVKKLRGRFQDASSAAANTPAERLVAWCAHPGVAEPRDRERVERAIAAVGRAR